MNSSAKHLLLMIGGALLVVGSVFAWRAIDTGTGGPSNRPGPSSASESAPHAVPSSAASSPASAEPSAENVAPSVRERMDRLRKRVESAPADTAARRELATLLFKAHEPEAAAKHYRAYLERRPQHRQAWLDLANAYGRVQKWDQALQAAKQMLTHFSDDPAALYNAGAAAANLQRYAAARKHWQRALRHDPSATVRTNTEEALQRLDSLRGPAVATP